MTSTQSFTALFALSVGLEKKAFPVQVQIGGTGTQPPTNGITELAVPSYWYIDLSIAPREVATDHHDPSNEIQTTALDLDLSKDSCSSFIAEYLQIAQLDPRATSIRLVFATTSGYVTRSDFLELRLQCCEQVAKVVSFLTPLQPVIAGLPDDVTASSLLQTLAHAVGGILVRHVTINSPSVALAQLDRELENRLSFPWLVLKPPQRKRIAWVQGRENINVSRQAYQAAYALGITLVVLDSPGHWLEPDDSPFAHLREAFVPVDLNFDPGFTQRIVKAVRDYPLPIDGVVTISDVRLKLVAEACEILGLPTSSSQAYIIAGDKAKTRILEPDANESFVLPSAEDLSRILASRGDQPLNFPVIVKPCLGWNSDCVSKVANVAELEEAVRRASYRHADAPDPSVGVVVEPYIDGPEVDANLVLLDGEVIFFDIGDDFPSRGDAADAGLNDGFQETRVVLPSALPASEIALLRDRLRESILRQGFTSGIFHCEARVRNSSAHYTTVDGVFDVRAKPEGQAKASSIYLHEINARPPGYLESVAVTQTYGVDYYALRLLLALGPSENERIRALAQPFLSRHQFHLSIVIIPQTQAGIMKTADAGAEFLLQHPELRDKIPYYDTWLKAGDVLEGPTAEALWWVANLSVVSRESRQDCLKLVKYVEDKFTYEVEDPAV